VAGQWFSQGPPVSSINKTDRYNITEILLKVAINTIKQTYLDRRFRVAECLSLLTSDGLLSKKWIRAHFNIKVSRSLTKPIGFTHQYVMITTNIPSEPYLLSTRFTIIF
jgi:hypothetical protein